MTQILSIVGLTMLCMLSPGPDMALVMRNTLLRGQRSGVFTSLGVLTGNLVHIAYCMLGIGWLIAHSIVAYSVLRYAGAAYLLFLGASSLRAAIRDEQGSADPIRPSAVGSYLQGFLNNVLNPKGALFYLGVFTQIIRPGTAHGHVAVMVVAMVTTSALFWVAFVFGLSLPAVRVRLARIRRKVDALFGVVLVALGLRVATAD